MIRCNQLIIYLLVRIDDNLIDRQFNKFRQAFQSRIN